MGNGGVFASFRIFSSLTTTSTSPASSFGFTVSADRRRTVPLTPTTNSERRRFALAICVASSASKTTCAMPSRSRTSTKRRPPRSRTRCTQPSSTTPAPTSAGRRAPQVWVRVRSPSCSATLLQSLEYLCAGIRLLVNVLGLRGEVLDRNGVVADLVLAEQGDKWNPPRISVLDLLADLLGVRVDDDTQARAAKCRGKPHRRGRASGVERRDHDVGGRGRERRRKHIPLAHDDENAFEAKREAAGRA